MFHVHVHERLARSQHVGAAHELGERYRQRRRLPEAPTTRHHVARLAVDHHRHEGDVVDEGVLDAAWRAAERHVDAAREDAVELGRAGEDGVARRPGVGEAVERFVERDPRVLRAHHVAQRVAARGAGGETDPFELREQIPHRSVTDPVQLQVLPGGEVQPILAVPVPESGHGPRLGSGQHPAGHPDAHHEAVILLLRADAPGLQRIAVVGGEPAVTIRGHPVEINGEPGSLRGSDVGCGHDGDGTDVGFRPADLAVANRSRLAHRPPRGW